MQLAAVLDNLLSPPILFFMLGIVAVLVRSDLSIPGDVAKGVSLYLLIAIGMHGGVELAAHGLDGRTVLILTVAAGGSAIVPLWTYALLRPRLGSTDAAAIAACYGSISAVTFITATGFLQAHDEPFTGVMIAAMAIMESPAIIVGVLLARHAAARDGDGTPRALASHIDWAALLRESMLNGAVLVLMGSLLIGYLTGPEHWTSLKPLLKDPFKGLLCLFLLDMGLLAARRLSDLRRAGRFTIMFGLVAPPVHAMLGLAVARVMNLSPGDALLMAVLWGSASYIAVPAAIRLALPEANASLYLPLSLGVTFPFNIAIGIPFYLWIIESFFP